MLENKVKNSRVENQESEAQGTSKQEQKKNWEESAILIG